MLVFRKPLVDAKAAQKTGKVWFYEVRNDGYDPDKIVGAGRPKTPEKNDIPALLGQWRIIESIAALKIAYETIDALTTLPPGEEWQDKEE